MSRVGFSFSDSLTASYGAWKKVARDWYVAGDFWLFDCDHMIAVC